MTATVLAVAWLAALAGCAAGPALAALVPPPLPPSNGLAGLRDAVSALPLADGAAALDAWTCADLALKTRRPEATAFCAAADCEALAGVLGAIDTLDARVEGGYPTAATARLVFQRADDGDGDGDDGDDDAAPDPIVAAVRIEGNFFEPAAEAAFRAACAGVLGGAGGLLGDAVLRGDRGAVVWCVPSAVARLVDGLADVAGVPVSAYEELAAVAVPVTQKSVKTVEKSLRVDAVASAGLGMSRSKVAKLVKSLGISVDGAFPSAPAKPVREGSVVTVKGKQITVTKIEQTAKGKYRVEMLRTSDARLRPNGDANPVEEEVDEWA
jgi:RNA-binding protein YlmH